MRVFDPLNSAYAVNLTYDKHTDRPTHISREISIEHPSVGLSSLAQLDYRTLPPATDNIIVYC